MSRSLTSSLKRSRITVNQTTLRQGGGFRVLSLAQQLETKVEVQDNNNEHELSGSTNSSNELTGAAKLMAEAEAEEEEERRLGKNRYKPRSTVEVDDSPVWMGEESTRDAVLRMLVDSHKPLRTGTGIISPEARISQIIKDTDFSPIIRVAGTPTDELLSSDFPSAFSLKPLADSIQKEREIPPEEFRPWHAKYVRQSSQGDKDVIPNIFYGKFLEAGSTQSNTFSLPSLLDRPPLPSDPKARAAERSRLRSEKHVGRVENAKEGALDYKLGGGQGFQAKGSSAAGGGVGRVAGMRAWQGLVEDRIERAREKGVFDNIEGKGKPLYLDPDQSNPHIDGSEFFMNRIIKRQGAKPPWIELLAELESTLTSFRSSLLSSYVRSLTRSLITSPFQSPESLGNLTVEEVERMRDGKWEVREKAYHVESVRQVNALITKMNILAPAVVRRGLITLSEELEIVYTPKHLP